MPDHVSSEAINKYDLLNRVNEALRLDIDVIPDDSVVMDRSLNSTRFRGLTHIYIPVWGEMIEDFVKRVQDYKRWRYEKIKQEDQREKRRDLD